MAFAQRESLAVFQADLFGDAVPTAASVYQVKREHVVNRLVEMLGDMRGAARWPWSETRTSLNRETVWPYLLRLLPAEESERWRRDLEAEAARLDAYVLS